MNPAVQRHFHALIARGAVRPGRVLEVGGSMGRKSLLHAPELAAAERFCLNLASLPSADGITAVTGNANRMDMFATASFDLVLCNVMLEHDRYFWLSIAEMKRVLRPGGLLIIGVPGFVKTGGDAPSTPTFRIHMNVDCYRFSPQAVREVFFEGLDRVEVDKILDPPRLIGHGYKPATTQRADSALRQRLEPIVRTARRRARTLLSR